MGGEANVEIKRGEEMGTDVEDGKLCAILMYIFPVGLIWYLVDEKMKANAFAKFHLKQALILWIAAIIVRVALGIFSSIIAFVPIIGWIFIHLVSPVFWLAFFVLWLVGLMTAINGREKEVPVIGKFAKNLTF
jgi:uncharacterized membrane protein